MPKATPPFWQTKSLEEMTRAEWESLCDGCARCCLNKYEDEATKEIFYTDVACHLLDTEACKCSNYRQRTRFVKDCIVLTPQVMPEMYCLPPTCAYRRVAAGKSLAWWHPLVSGDPETVHTAGISVRGRCVSEAGMTEDEIEKRFVKWPMNPKSRRP